MTFYYAVIRRYSVSLLRFPSFSHVHVFSCEILFINRLKSPQSFPSHFCFKVIVFLLVFVLSVLFLVTVINLCPRFSMQSSSHSTDASTLFSLLVSPFPSSFLDTYSLSISSLGRNTLCIYISFFFFDPFA